MNVAPLKEALAARNLAATGLKPVLKAQLLFKLHRVQRI